MPRFHCAGFSAFGWMFYLGLESINMLCICAVFLVAAVGVDCTFIFVSAMKAAGPDTPLADAVPMAMAEGASAITLTSLTSIMAFIVSAAASTAQPAYCMGVKPCGGIACHDAMPADTTRLVRACAQMTLLRC